MYRIIRVNMSDLSIKTGEIPEEYQGLGGRGMTSAIVSKEVEPTANAIGPNNKLVIVTMTPLTTSTPIAISRISNGCSNT